MARTLYTLLFYLILPFALMRLWWRGRKAPEYRLRWNERLGLPAALSFREPPIWIHAVSVGESVAAAPLVEKLLAAHPSIPVLITTMTPTGSARVKALFGERVVHVYAPYDLPLCIHNFLCRTNPRVLVIMETELWPNWIHCCQERGIPTVLANGRLSAKSAAGYARFSGLVTPMFRKLSWIAVQEEPHANRFIELGARADFVDVLGSIKFDMEVDPDLSRQAVALRECWGSARQVIVAGSTHEGEERLLLDVHRNMLKSYPELLLIIVPRHPERFADVAKLLAQGGWSFCRWTDRERLSPKIQVLLVDTMGELLSFYAAADIAFVGGSLIARGGHNPLEPAALAVPVVMGEAVFNFQDICDRLQAAGALTLASEAALEDVFMALTDDELARHAKGAQGKAFVEMNRGALDRLYEGLMKRLK